MLTLQTPNGVRSSSSFSSDVPVEIDLFSRATRYHHSVGACVLPIDRDGSPCVQEWKKWHQETQTLEEVSTLAWGKAAGLALVSGAHEWHCLRLAIIQE